MSPVPPRAPKRELLVETHGRVRSDPYAWLRDRDDPAVRAYLEAENAHTDAVMGATTELQRTIYQEMVARIREADEGVPARDGPFEYYLRTEVGRNYAVHCRRAVSPTGELGPEQIYLDENELAADKGYFALRELAVAPGHHIVAWAADHSGNERYTVRFRELDTLRDRPDVIDGVGRQLVWSADGRFVLYLRIDDADRPFEVWRHELGTPVDADVRVYVEADERFHVELRRGRSRRFAYITCASRTTGEVWFVPTADPCAAPQLVAARRPGIEYAVDDHDERFFVVTNDGAREFQVMVADIARPAGWRPFIAGRDDTHIERVESFARHLVVSLRREGQRVLEVIELATGERHAVEMPEPAYFVDIGPNPVHGSTALRIFYSSLVTSLSVVDYDMDTRGRVLRKQYDVLGYDPSTLVCERRFAEGAGGVRVPISLVRRKQDVGTATPLLLLGYGAYGFSFDPRFSSQRLSLLERGVAVAIAHVRGGGELGRHWYEDGKLSHKHNTFGDFIAVAEHLIAHGYTTADRLAIHGGSAGGLLVGAVINLRPELFAAAIAEVPFVDVLNTMLDPTLPLTVIEREEWGDPLVPRDYDYIAGYAPYENVAAERHPHLLALAGWSDPRVGYWEPAKWIARLRDVGLPGSEILLRTNLGAGHGGPSGRYPALAEAAFTYAFLLRHIGAGAASGS